MVRQHPQNEQIRRIFGTAQAPTVAQRVMVMPMWRCGMVCGGVWFGGGRMLRNVNAARSLWPRRCACNAGK